MCMMKSFVLAATRVSYKIQVDLRVPWLLFHSPELDDELISASD